MLFCLASASPLRVATCLRKLPATDGSRQWVYLGRDFLGLTRWESRLRSGLERIQYAPELQRLAMELRGPYLDWITTLGKANDSLAWWTSRIAERNTALDSLFHALCYFQLGRGFVLKTPPPTLFVVENPAVLSALVRYARRHGLPAVQCRSGYLRWRASLARKALANWAYYFLDALQLLRAAKSSRLPSASLSGTSKPLAVIHTYVDESFFGDDGAPHDRYFPRLADELRRSGWEVATMPRLANVRRERALAFAWFRRKPADYLIPEDYYLPIDYLWAALIGLTQISVPRGHSFTFQRLDVSELVAHAKLQQVCDPSAAYFLPYAQLIRKLRRTGTKVSLFIDTFENLIVEKPPIIALRRWMPAARIAGFQHTLSLPPLLLSACTTPTEAAFAPHPDVIVCNSKFTLEQLASAGFPAENLRVGPSLRFQHLMEKLPARLPEPNSVLVTLALDPKAASELIFKIMRAFPTDEGIRWWIKHHPMMDEKQLRAAVGRVTLPNHMTPVVGPLEELTARAACGVSMGSSSALEIALAGVPLVVVAPDCDLDLNSLATLPGADPPVYSSASLRQAVLRNLNLSPEERARIERRARAWRKQCISPLTRQTLSAFLSLP